MKYIHLEDGFVDVEVALDKNLVGVTFDDLYAGKYVLLNEKQLAFLDNNPGITPVEAFLMVCSPSKEEIFNKRKADKYYQIYKYDISEAVNVFFVNGSPMWLNRATRASLFTTIAAYKAANKTEITLWTAGSNPVPMTLDLGVFEGLLLALEVYAKECYDNTSEHKANVSNIETIEELVAYNHTAGYPEPLRVEL